MSTDLLLAAVLDTGDVDSSASSESEAPDDGKDVKVLPEAMSHTAAESIDDVTEEAMSHKSCSESKKGTHKKKKGSRNVRDWQTGQENQGRSIF